MYKPYGVLPAMVTPMNNDESINENELRRQVNRFIESGVHGLFCLGTNGEFFSLSFDEKISVMKTVIDENKGRLPVCVGVGCVTTAETVKLSQVAQREGADALSVITPFFGEVSQEELYNHYKSVAENVNIPIILYNIPARTGCNIAHTTVEKLASIKNIVGIKDSSGNFDNTLRYLEITNREFSVVAGNDSLILYTLMAGGTGAIAGTANLFPAKMASIYELWKAGKIEEAIKVQDGIRPMRDCLKLGNPNSVVKRTLNLLGCPVGPARKPFAGSPEKWDCTILDTIDKYFKEWN